MSAAGCRRRSRALRLAWLQESVAVLEQRAAAAHLPHRAAGAEEVLQSSPLRSSPSPPPSARNVTERNPASPDTLLLGTVMHTSPLLLREKNGDAPRITPGAGFYFILLFFLFFIFCLLLLLLLLQWTGRLASPKGCPPSRLPARPPACVRQKLVDSHPPCS